MKAKLLPCELVESQMGAAGNFVVWPRQAGQLGVGSLCPIGGERGQQTGATRWAESQNSKRSAPKTANEKKLPTPKGVHRKTTDRALNDSADGGFFLLPMPTSNPSTIEATQGPAKRLLCPDSNLLIRPKPRSCRRGLLAHATVVGRLAPCGDRLSGRAHEDEPEASSKSSRSASSCQKWSDIAWSQLDPCEKFRVAFPLFHDFFGTTSILAGYLQALYICKFYTDCLSPIVRTRALSYDSVYQQSPMPEWRLIPLQQSKHTFRHD
ncbi:unnamed protein product [Protopolystoma xenopodis]|uniref:Uncharacterized protein n=1 Tax=Protopolystoma xenopodis TaxID=117903 RepID=A0A3S5B7K4_9PLAT|nr:unnamed protein product [Protopolystoma xenopodis]